MIAVQSSWQTYYTGRNYLETTIERKRPPHAIALLLGGGAKEWEERKHGVVTGRNASESLGVYQSNTRDPKLYKNKVMKDPFRLLTWDERGFIKRWCSVIGGGCREFLSPFITARMFPLEWGFYESAQL